MRPGDFLSLAKKTTLEFLRTILPDEAIEKVSRGELIAEFRVDDWEEDMKYLGGFEELPAAVLEDYRSDVLNGNIINREALSRLSEGEEVWLTWDPDTNRRYFIPGSVVQSFNHRPHQVTPDLQAPWEE